MKIVASDESRRLCDLLMVHGDRQLVWDAAIYNKATKATVEEIFYHINQFWATLPEPRQAAIFDVYAKLHEVFQTVFDANTLLRVGSGLVKELYTLHPLDELTHWTNFHSDIRYPLNLKTEYSRDDIKERTYLVDDYKDLIVLGLALRPMIPLWGVYMGLYANDSGSRFKESVAFRLMRQAWPMYTKAMERLQLYLENSIPKNATNFSAILNALGTADLPDWLLGLAIVRRISVATLSSVNEKDSIISNVYNFIITNTVNSLDRKFSGVVLEKHRTGDNAEEKGSLIENYKVKEPVAGGDLVTLSVYTEQAIAMTKKIDPTVDEANIERCLEIATTLQELDVLQHHRTISQWVMSPAIPPRGIDNLTKPALLRVLASTQALLWHWGFPELAVLMTASPFNMDEDTMTGLESRPRVSKELLDNLVQLYPHPQRSGGRQAIEQPDKMNRQNNDAHKAIELLTRDISFSEWNIIAPPELVSLTSMLPGSRRMPIPNDIKSMLARLIVKIATRSQWLEQ